MEVDNAPDWDDDHIQEAERQIQEMRGWDDDAAEFLRRTLEAAKLKQQRDRPKPWDLPGVAGVRIRSRRPYDPSRLYARCMMVYGGLNPFIIDELHYRMFFALAREAVVQQEEERAEWNRVRGNRGEADPDPAYVRRAFSDQVVDTWDGNLHRLPDVEGS